MVAEHGEKAAALALDAFENQREAAGVQDMWRPQMAVPSPPAASFTPRPAPQATITSTTRTAPASP